MATCANSYRRMIDNRPSNLLSWTVLVLLWPLSRLFRVLSGVRGALYGFAWLPVYRAAVPVISIGNLTVGGTGKTPVTDALVKRLLKQELRVAVVSRGYGGSYRSDIACVAKGDGQLHLSPQEAGDEPYLLAQRNPALRVYVARKRARGVQAAERAGAQVIVLDDGFQHRAVHRDLDIVLLDSRAPFGNAQLLPAGPLREPPKALKRAHLVIMTHATQSTQKVPFAGPMLSCRHSLADTLQTLDGRAVPWTDLVGQKVAAFAGIARPEDFFTALRKRGVTLTTTLTFNDHQEYGAEQLNHLRQSCQNIKLWITTEKDAVKLDPATLPCRCLVASLKLDFDESGELDRILDGIVNRVKTHHQGPKGTKRI